METTVGGYILPSEVLASETSLEGWKLCKPIEDRASDTASETSLEGWKHPEQRDERIVALLPKLP